MRVGVVGATGRMGTEVCRAVSGAEGMDLVAAVDPKGAGQVVQTSLDAGHPLDVESGIEALEATGAQVAVDFTDADSARHNVSWCLRNGIHAVVGTTGLSEHDLEALADAAEAGGANALVATNFAIGAVLLARFCELAAPHLEGVEIIELHHDEKRDAPSGTALRTAELIAAARRRAGVGDLPPDPTTEVTLAGTRGGEGPGGVRVHSVRLPGLVAHQEVVFGAPGQSLTIRHDSYDRRSFMPGVLLAVREIAGRPGVTLGLEPLLGM